MVRLVGIDIGTTGVRAVVLDERGARLADAAEPCVYDAPAPGRAEADPESWWTAVCAALGRVDAGLLTAADAVAVTGQAPTAVLVDANARPIRPAILWLDVRADREARAIDESLGPGGAQAIGGNRMHPYFLGPKIAWLRRHDAPSLSRAALVLQSHAFLAMRLTRVAVCDGSTAMLCAPLFDARALAWSRAGADAAGVDLAKLPPVVASHEVIGAVTPAAAAATGLRAGTPVVAGGGDFAASALSAGVVDEGQACLMLGTAGNLLLPLNEARFDDRLINSRHVGCDRWLSLGGTLCGAALEWFRRACAEGASWETLEEEARAVPPGAGGVVALPYLQGERTPVWDERARGVFFGVDLTHGRGHLYRALVEGIALGFRDCLAVARAHGLAVREVTAVNGAGRSALLRQTLCDALGVPLTWASDASGAGTAAGAAILAGLGIGAAPARFAAAAPAARHEPDPRAQESLARAAARRAQLYDAVRSCFA